MFNLDIVIQIPLLVREEEPTSMQAGSHRFRELEPDVS